MRTLWACGLVLLLLLNDLSTVGAEPIGRVAFRRVWERADSPVQRNVARRAWLWGPEAISVPLQEAASQSPGRRRLVQYFDKARMEITNPSASSTSEWYVSTGLLVSEMILGRVEVGNRAYIPLPSPAIPVAGDMTNTFPTYASLRSLYGRSRQHERGDNVTTLLTPTGSGSLSKYATDPATEIVRIERSLGIPRVFWDFLNRTGTIYRNGQDVPNQPIINSWLFVMGYPVTEPFWVKVKVGGVADREVLVQAFERRLLTYTPSNSAAFRVEMGNVGRHYYRWRYADPFARGRRAIITTPRVGTTVGSPLLVQGFENGQAFEGAIEIRLKRKSDGSLLTSVNTTVMQADVGRPGPFEARLAYETPSVDTAALLEVLTTAASDGAEILLTRSEIVLKGEGDT